MGDILTSILFTILAIASLVMIVVGTAEREVGVVIIGIIALIACISIIAICIKNINQTYNTIPAIEVYRGNTSLQITYIDNIPQDTIVIYKHKVLHNL